MSEQDNSVVLESLVKRFGDFVAFAGSIRRTLIDDGGIMRNGLSWGP